MDELKKKQSRGERLQTWDPSQMVRALPRFGEEREEKGPLESILGKPLSDLHSGDPLKTTKDSQEDKSNMAKPKHVSLAVGGLNFFMKNTTGPKRDEPPHVVRILIFSSDCHLKGILPQGLSRTMMGREGM
jgi:hypothetical protein